MKRYLITVKGISYEVEVEELKENSSRLSKEPVQTEPKEIKETKTEAPVPKAAPVSAGGSKNITCPMPGSILKVLVKPGDKVKKGDVLIILEAMKMENEIFASSDEIIASIDVKEGTTVNTGDVLITFK
ncbi:MAG TPA: acetyl-CoA carboxylase biotin carboxyl carrier protein subunit [Clostridiales bacterium]|nr:acetyl-CoA carboxylase biotin carboxyl carrier protein subunit [Clostridiales bacterium]